MFTQRKILVVEDNEINRMMLSAILSSEYEVLEAENGQAALAVLRKYRDGIALILLDIIMPVMDGYTFLARMQEDPALASIPVIVTTQSDDESDEVTALSHGPQTLWQSLINPRLFCTVLPISSSSGKQPP